MAEIRLKAIPSPSSLPPEIQAFAGPVKEALDVLLGRVGSGEDAAVTKRNAGQIGGGSTIINTGTASGGAYVPDLTEPPAPMGLVATPGFAVINLEWDDTPYTVGHGHAYTVVYRSSDAMRGNAVQIGMTPGTIYVDAAGSSAGPFYYWVRYVTHDGVMGPWNAVSGVEASTATDPSYLLDLLAGSIDESSLKTEAIGGKDAFVFSTKTFAIKYGGTGYVPFIVQTTPAVINGQTIPAGVYLDAAFMRRFVAQAGQIGALAVDDAAIANVSAAKLTIGDGTVGGRLKSAYFSSGVAGWQIHPDGTAEFNNVLVHGTVYAESGYFKGTLMGGAATSINAGAGMWAGYESSVYKFRLGAPGSSRMEWTGSALNVYDSNGNITISSGVVDWGKVGGSNKPADNAAAGVVLVNQGGMSITGNTAQKIASGWLYDSGFCSKDGYTGGAYVSWAMSNTTDIVIVGLNTDPAADNSYTSIDYGLLCYGDGLLYAYESGNQQGSAIGTRAPGDVYAITYDGSQVRYFQNGFVIRSVSATITGRLYADSSFATPGATVKNIQFGPLSSNNWASIGGAGKPQDNATVGAVIGTNLGGTFNTSNIGVYMPSAAIGDAQIDRGTANKLRILEADIETASVSTLKIKGNAVTVPAYVESSGVTLSSDSYVQFLGTSGLPFQDSGRAMMTLSMIGYASYNNATGYNVTCHAKFEAYCIRDSDGATFTYSKEKFLGDFNSNESGSSTTTTYFDIPFKGTYYFRAYLRLLFGGGLQTLTIQSISFSVNGVMR